MRRIAVWAVWIAAAAMVATWTPAWGQASTWSLAPGQRIQVDSQQWGRPAIGEMTTLTVDTLTIWAGGRHIGIATNSIRWISVSQGHYNKAGDYMREGILLGVLVDAAFALLRHHVDRESAALGIGAAGLCGAVGMAYGLSKTYELWVPVGRRWMVGLGPTPAGAGLRMEW